MHRQLPIALTGLAALLTSAALGAPATATGRAATAIHDLQGTTRLGKTGAATVGGIVTALRTAGSKGFWIQDPHADADPRTSEGLFVFTNAAPAVTIGDNVTVSGTVSEYYPGGAQAGGQSITQLSTPTITVASHGNPLPAPVKLTDKDIPSPYAPDGAIETKPLEPTKYGLDYYETLEGMRVQVSNARVVGPTNSHAELTITAKPSERRTPRGGTLYGGYDQQNSGRLTVSTLAGPAVPRANVGDMLAGDTVGVLDYDQFGGYRIAATSLGKYTDKHLKPEVTAAAGAGELTVATYNVENLDPKDPPAKFDRLAAGIVTNLRSPAVVTLEEIQDNNRATNDGTVAADQTYAKLLASISAAGGPHYQYRQIDPVNNADGGEPGGNIRVGFLFNPATVSFTDRPGGDATTAVTVVKHGATAALSASPGRISPAEDAWHSSRKPLVGEFVFGGKTVFVIANHFNSKGGDLPLTARQQPVARPSEVQRRQQTAVVRAFVDKLLAAQPNANIVVLGDMNDYSFSPAITPLTAGGALIDPLLSLPAAQQYSYVYQGNSQAIDHTLLSRSLAHYTYDLVHLNSEFADQASDHDPQVTRLHL